jgi:hypothetical protein
MAKLQNDPDVGALDLWYQSDTPITMTRNRCVIDAEHRGVDYLLMVDSDNHPDYSLGTNPGAKPCWESSWESMRAHNGPCVVAAPYCGVPPNETVHAFRWAAHESDHPNPDFALQYLSREEASLLKGIQPAAAAATGVILFDMRGLKKLPHPRFYYEWKDETETVKASTEDVAITRDLNYAGCPVYINWDAWAAHYKLKAVGKPHRIAMKALNRQMKEPARRAVQQGWVDDGGDKEPPRRIRPVNTYSTLPPGVDPKTVYRNYVPCTVTPEEAEIYPDPNPPEVGGNGEPMELADVED